MNDKPNFNNDDLSEDDLMALINQVNKRLSDAPPAPSTDDQSAEKPADDLVSLMSQINTRLVETQPSSPTQPIPAQEEKSPEQKPDDLIAAPLQDFIEEVNPPLFEGLADIGIDPFVAFFGLFG